MLEQYKAKKSSKLPHFEISLGDPQMSEAEAREYLDLRNALHALSTKENERLLWLSTTYHPTVVRR